MNDHQEGKSQTTPRDIIEKAVELVCSDGNSNPKMLAIGIMNLLALGGWKIVRDER